MARERRKTRHTVIPQAVNGGARGRGGGTHTFNTVKSWCTPAREFITAAFTPLGIKASYGPIVLEFEEDADGNQRAIPSAQEQTVTVNESQADWAEYVLGSVCGQVGMRVTSGIRTPSNFARGKARKGVPMPWMYDAMDGIPDGIALCAKTKAQKEAIQEGIKAGEIDPKLLGTHGLAFTHEGRQRVQKAQKRARASKRTRKTGKRPQGRPVTSRGGHRGKHRGR